MQLDSEKKSSLPKLIVLSTLLTWAGGHPAQTTDFVIRSPAVGYANAHVVENSLYCMHQKGFDAHVVGVGLVYGSGGFDFEAIFRLYTTLPMINAA